MIKGGGGVKTCMSRLSHFHRNRFNDNLTQKKKKADLRKADLGKLLGDKGQDTLVSNLILV